jgi:type II secretory ATPase GspE/PulE/Tfp pilus assembly ATPase PilB-like protein
LQSPQSQSPHHRFGLALAALFCAAGPAWAGADFPRGPGLYFNLFSVTAVLLVYFAWTYACYWVDRDAKRFELDRYHWNALVVGGGGLGLLLFWTVPWFPIAYPLLLAAVAVPLVAYVRVRNRVVGESQKVWTQQHLKKLLLNYIGLDLGLAPEGNSGPELHFLPRPGEQPGQERPRVRRSQRLPGYPAALDLVCDAVLRRAAELHLEPTQDKTEVRLQIDGVYHDTDSLSHQTADRIVEVLKTWADLDPAEKSQRQEGAFAAEIDGGRVDCGLVAEDAAGRERLVLSIEDHTQRIVKLDQLGMPERLRDSLRTILTLRSGLFLICGPDNSGRTTTAYGCLHELDRMRRSILTVESPIHQRVARFEQIELNRQASETFAGAMRKLLPGQGRGVVLVGEIDDFETADQACLKAEEGRFVIATCRAHDAVQGLFRLIELGVAPERLAEVLLSVLSQRLLRLLCDDCKACYRPDEAAVRRANLPAERIRRFCRVPEEADLKRSERGQLIPCRKCGGIGYHGRTGIFELLLVSPRMRELLRHNPSAAAIKQEAVKSGMNYLQDQALELVIRGATSIQEMIQVLKE